ncbi:hypothetical protein AAE478_005343 [Parahypoxylon ruwenzoriense]
MSTLFWAIALAYTVFKLTNLSTFKHIKYRTNLVAKAVVVILPAILMCLLRLDVVQSSQAAFLVLANFNIMISLTLGSLLLMAILVKYIYTRHRLVSWNAQYLLSRRSQDVGGEIINVLDCGESRRSIYDRWLVLRFSTGFVVLGSFQFLTILSEVAQLSNNTEERLGEAANLSAARARSDFLLFMPGVSTSLLVFIVFGTTRTFRRAMYRAFIPKMFQRRCTSDFEPAAHVRNEGVRVEEDFVPEFRGLANEGPLDIRLKKIDCDRATTAETSDQRLNIADDVDRGRCGGEG